MKEVCFMQQTKRHVAVAAGLALALTGSCGIVPQLFEAKPALAQTTASSEITLADAKAIGTKTDVGAYGSMYVVAVKQTDHTNNLELKIFGELKLPYTSQDIDLDNQDENWFKPNEYVKSFFEWSPTDPSVGTYDRTVFQNKLPVFVKKGTRVLKMQLNGEDFELAVPADLSSLDTSPLQDALTEHKSQYEAAKAYGMKISEESSKAFEAEVAACDALLKKAQDGPSSVTQDEITAQRQKLNEAFGALKPLPYDRVALKAALDKAQKALNRIPELAKDGMGFEKSGFDAFYRSYLAAKDLDALEDLAFIIGPHEGGPLKTQRDFDTTADELNRLTQALNPIKMDLAKTDSLRETYFNALDVMPQEGFGWTPASRTAFYEALEHAKIMLNTLYPEQRDVDSALSQLQTATKALEETKLDTTKPKYKPFTLGIRYRHHNDSAPSALIDEYFEADGSPIKEVIENVIPGSEQRIYLDNFELIKRFAGFTPTTFFYGSDDSSLGKVHVFTDRNGRSFIAFAAELNSELDVKYEKGDDTRKDPNQTDPSDDNTVDNNNQSQVQDKTKHANPSKTVKGTTSSNKLPHTGDASSALAAVASVMSAALAGVGSLCKRRSK